MKQLDLKDNFLALTLAIFSERFSVQDAIRVMIDKQPYEEKPSVYKTKGRIKEEDIQNMIRLRESEDNWTYERIAKLYGLKEGNSVAVHIEKYKRFLSAHGKVVSA